MKLTVAMAAWMVSCMMAVFGQEEIRRMVCRINGQSYARGESVGKVIDRCNLCCCGEEGFYCTRMGCRGFKPLHCEIQGQRYDSGDVAPAGDCKRCRCVDGNLACIGCPA